MTKIFNRNSDQAFAPLPDLADLEPLAQVWLPIEVPGRHLSTMGDEPIVEVIDAQAVDSIAREFWKDEANPDFPGLLVDNDHLRHDLSASTEAKAWVKRIENRGGVPWGLLEFTDVGAAAIRNKRWKFLSSEYDADGCEFLGRDEQGRRMFRPLRMSGLTLTNMPNHKGQKPITNRKALDSIEAEQTQPNKKPMNKTALEKLGLGDDATEDQFNAKLDELIAKAAKADSMEAEAEVETILNRHAKRFPAADRGKWKDRLIKNRTSAEEILADLPEIAEQKEVEQPKGRPAITNRTTAATPDASRANGEGAEKTDSAKAAAIRNRAGEIQKAEGVPFGTAFARAQQEAGH